MSDRRSSSLTSCLLLTKGMLTGRLSCIAANLQQLILLVNQFTGQYVSLLQLGWYITNIAIYCQYRHYQYRIVFDFRDWFFWYIDIISETSEISVISGYFIILLVPIYYLNSAISCPRVLRRQPHDCNSDALITEPLSTNTRPVSQSRCIKRQSIIITSSVSPTFPSAS